MNCFLLFPGRHLVNTRFQEDYLRRVLSTKPSELPGFIAGRSPLSEPPNEIIFAITSANQENSRFNPIPFHVRAMGVDRFARPARSIHHLPTCTPTPRGISAAWSTTSRRRRCSTYDKGKSDAVKQQYWLYVSMQNAEAT